jgi:hypothetical protein
VWSVCLYCASACPVCPVCVPAPPGVFLPVDVFEPYMFKDTGRVPATIRVTQCMLKLTF